jgi:hypothetical protein
MTADHSIFVKVPQHEHGFAREEHLEELGWFAGWAGQIWGRRLVAMLSARRHAFGTCGAYTPGYQSLLFFV